MTSSDFAALSPLLALALASIAVMLSIAVHRRHSVSLGLSGGALILSFACVFIARSVAPRDATILFRVDTLGLFYVALAIGCAAIVVALGYSYLARRESHPEEYYILVLIATAGACVMAISTHFVSFYLGLEILSVAQYGLVAYLRRDPRGTEAGLKYLVLAASSAAFLLFGMALVYAELGTMQFADLAKASPEQVQNHVVLLGVAMMFCSIGFKLSIVPFHYWTSDIYEGAPVSIAAFAATVGKAGVLALVVRYFAVDDAPVSESLQGLVVVTSAASMIVGNLLALIQTNIKRLLAYSSIAHMGYLSVAFLASSSTARDTVGFYFVTYSLATLAAFGVVMRLSAGFHRGKDAEALADYRGLYRQRPALALILAVSLISLAGIPLTAGFIGKLYAVFAGAEGQHWALLIILALSSAIGAYYYLRIAVGLFLAPDPVVESSARWFPETGAQLLLGALALALVILGLYPAPLLALLDMLSS